jgi:hypothetical protein
MTVGGPTLYGPEELGKMTGVKPGKPASLTPRFSNPSRFSTQRGIALRMTAPGGLVLTARPRNCSYNPAFTDAWCTFPAKAAPRTAYRTSSPFTFTFTSVPEELTGTLEYSWSSDPQRPAKLTVRGTGAPLTLTRTPEGGIHDGTGAVTVVETTVQADYAAAAGTVRGRVGDTVGVTLGVRGLGPGRPTEERGRFEVVPPEGTTVTSIPYTFEDTDGKWACARPEKPGGAFVCDLNSDVLWPGADGTTSVGFRFRIDRQVPGAHGTIRTYNPYDRTPGNDTARIPLEASPAPPYRAVVRPAVLIPAVLAAVAAAAAGVAYRRRRRAVS